MAVINCALGIAILLAVLTTEPVHATTLVVFYSKSSGAILATDSVVGKARIDSISRGRGIPTEFRKACKINKCGPYFVAGAGFSGAHTGKTSNDDPRCQGSYKDIEAMAMSYRRRAVEELNQYVSYLVSNKQAPAVNDVLRSTAIAGFEGGRPVLRYFDISYTGAKQNKLTFRVTSKVACPGDRDCLDLKLVAGERDAVLLRQGSFKNVYNPVGLAEEFVQIAIEAHRKTQYVLPPVSVLQFQNEKPHWFRRGLCQH